MSTGGRFRYPLCCHEAVLDYHGVYGLQRNLLVENIIDIYRQEECSRSVVCACVWVCEGYVTGFCKHPPEPECSYVNIIHTEHDEEMVNIYCLSCETPTCSMCKGFGQHKDCEVAPLQNLSDGIAILVAGNDRIQALLSQMEETCRSIQNGRRQKQSLCGKFDGLYAILEERKKELDDKLDYIRSLIRRHDYLEGTVKLVETAIQSMEEPEMAVFLQVSNMERPEPGYESKAHFVINTENVADVLRTIDFNTGSQGKVGEDGYDLGFFQSRKDYLVGL
ncbi:unnamed protein product, partial [Coregonus sp. 'balchen']